MKYGRKLTALLLAAAMAAGLAGCGDRPVSNQAEGGVSVPDVSAPAPEVQDKFEQSDARNDTDVGLKNIKIDAADRNLTEEQKLVLNYFDNDYLHLPLLGQESIRRYPKVFDNAQLHVMGVVRKILSQNGDNYEAVVLAGFDGLMYSDAIENGAEDLMPHMEDFVLIRGVSEDALILEEDLVEFYGRYTGVETIQMDGTSYTVPVVEVNQLYQNDGSHDNVIRYSTKYIKQVAEAVFGDDIQVYEPIEGQDFPENVGEIVTENPFCMVELENQSNAKFTKYRFYQYQGLIEDAKDGIFDSESNIQRTLEFSADFEHYFLFTYDGNLETMTLEYYDKELNKLWKREFEETTSAAYDYTKNNIYLSANNEMYIIDLATGEDTFDPVFIGEILDVRKLTDGILCIRASKSDAVMKLDNRGGVIWKTNGSSVTEDVYGVQLVEDRIIYDLWQEDGGCYMVLDNKTGELLQEVRE